METKRKPTKKQLEALVKGRAKLQQLRGVVGEFGEQFTQFYHKPTEAIKHLLKVKRGECVGALHRADIGDIDIVWGENDPKTNKGFGLKHIVEKHGKEIKRLGFDVASFITIIVQFGTKQKAKESDKILLESNCFRVVILTKWKSRKKKLLLTAFDLIKKPKT